MSIEITPESLAKLEDERAALDRKIQEAREALRGPVPKGWRWSEDRDGPVLEDSDATTVLFTDNGRFVIGADYDGTGVSWPIVEEFRKRTLAWRAAQPARRGLAHRAGGSAPFVRPPRIQRSSPSRGLDLKTKPVLSP